MDKSTFINSGAEPHTHRTSAEPYDITTHSSILKAVDAIRAAKERLVRSDLHLQIQEKRLNRVMKAGSE